LVKGADRKVFLIPDNHRVHHSKEVKAWLEANKEKIEACYLPSYSPDLKTFHLNRLYALLFGQSKVSRHHGRGTSALL
jgi:transposase